VQFVDDARALINGGNFHRFNILNQYLYLEINKLPCLHEIDIPKCINVYSIYRTKLGVIGFFVLKYWFKMLKRWKFPPLIKARASSTNCTMGNLTCSRHATYLHTIYVKSREIHSGQDSNLNFKLLSSLIIPNVEAEPSFLWQYKYFWMNRRSFIENSAPDLYLLRIVYHHLSKWQRVKFKLKYSRVSYI
jgi:hypothetical protein